MQLVQNSPTTFLRMTRAPTILECSNVALWKKEIIGVRGVDINKAWSTKATSLVIEIVQHTRIETRVSLIHQVALMVPMRLLHNSQGSRHQKRDLVEMS